MLVTSDSRVLNELGAFASLYDISDLEGISQPVLVLKAEEPGSKQKLAFDYGYEDTICHDMINHLVNDIIVMGAKPLAVLDVVITGNVNEVIIKKLVKEMAQACKNNLCSLVGGETSIQPGIISDNLCVLSSSVIGVVDKSKIIDGNTVSEGDSILAVASNGLHTNGYSLVRKMIEMDKTLTQKEVEGGETFLQCVMKAHTAYYPIIGEVINLGAVHAMAHITGGGIEGNLCRVIPEGLEAQVNLSLIQTLPIFKYIKEFGEISDEEMLSTFNCGVGLIMVVSAEHKKEVQKLIEPLIPCYEIGVVASGKEQQKVSFNKSLRWD